jgi:hypothetical protein
MVVLAELGRFPMLVQWAKLTARFWSRMVSMDDGRIVKQAFKLNLQLATQIPASWPAERQISS